MCPVPMTWVRTDDLGTPTDESGAATRTLADDVRTHSPLIPMT